jgi:hypothetical protein
VVLDPPANAAAKTLARTLGITPSEAIRRALIAYRDQVLGGVSAPEIRRRRAAFDNLMELMDGNARGARRLGSPRKRAADVAIGVTAVLRGAPLVTRNAKDFRGIDGLTIESVLHAT